MNTSKLSSERDTNKPGNQKQLMNEILIVTMDIKTKCPELYEHLNETPLFVSYDSKEISSMELEQYLNTLKLQLKNLRFSFNRMLKNA